MNNLLRCREIETLCRQRAVSDRAHRWKWLGEADRWNHLAHCEIASRFQHSSMHAGPMVMGPNTSNAGQAPPSRLRLQSAACGG